MDTEPSLIARTMSERKKKKKSDDEITFVVTNNPLASSAANRRRVRSVAALRSWPQRRKKTFEQSQAQNPPNHGGFVLDLPGPAAGPSKVDRSGKAQHDSTHGTSETRVYTFVNLKQPSGSQPEVVEEEPLFEKCTRAVDENCHCAHCLSERIHLRPGRPTLLLRTRKRAADGHLKMSEHSDAVATIPAPPSPKLFPMTVLNRIAKPEPFNQYPVPYKPWFDYVLHHMMHVFAPRGWPALRITKPEGLKWEWFMTQQALSEPALFYVRLLFATGDLIRLKTLQPEVSYWLQNKAVQAINDALLDPKRATSDALILAVGRIALFESFYGDKNAATTIHRPAQKRMISLRGGMKNLPFPDLVKRLVRGSDHLMAQQSGTARLLEDDECTQDFSTKQHIDLLEAWVPSEARDLRRKIRISDLLSTEPSKPP